MFLQIMFATAQTLAGLEQGIKPYGSYDGGDIDSISMVNGSLTLNIPIISYPQRGGKLHMGFKLVYANTILQPYAACNPVTHTCNNAGYQVNHRLQSSDQPPVSVVPDFEPLYAPSSGPTAPATVTNFDGAVHTMMGTTGQNLISIDATGYSFLGTVGTIIDRQGTRYSNSTGTVEDVNGNLITQNVNSQLFITGWNDTMGRVIPAAYPAGMTSTSNFSGCTGSQPTTSASLWTPPGPNGGTSQFKFCYASFSISFTAPDCINNASHSFCQPTSTVLSYPQSLVLPSGAAWTFEYNNVGDLSSITLPTGGTISYTWSYTSGLCVGPQYYSNGVNTWLYPYGRAITSRTVNANDGTGSHIWNYSIPTTINGQSFQSIVTDPALNDSVHTETSLAGACSVYETELDQYSGSHTGTPLKKVTTAYNYTYNSNLPDGGVAFDVVPATITTTDVLSGKVSQTTKTYDTGVSIGSGSNAIYGDLLTQSDYDYGNGSPGNLLRTMTNTYMIFSGPNAASYLANNLLTLPYTVQVKDGGGNQTSLTQYNYDETSRASSGLTSSYQFDSAPPAGTYRGNNTSAYHWLNSGTFTCPNGHSGGSGGYLIGKTAFFDDGMLNTFADPCSNTITYAYSLTYWGALATSITNALNQGTTKTYDFNTSSLASTTDPNNLTTSYSYDSMWRLSHVNRPDGGLDTITHQETTFPFSATLTTSINSSQNKVETNVFDGLGRISENQLTSDPQGTVYADTTYDTLGRVSTVSNPYRTGTDATTSSGTTTYRYDALSRKISVTYPDTSVLNTAYCGPSTLVTDPTGKWRRSRVDGLGRVVEVDEPNAVGASVNSNGCPGTGEPIWITSYTVDALGNLTQVVQNGSHQRNFTYDSLSRLLSAVNPENSNSSNPVKYAYNPDNTLLSKTDARSITANYAWDALYRETGVSYSNSDPPLAFAYDQSNCLSLSACQNIGYRTSMTDGAGSESWAYQVDSTNLRGIHREQRTNNSSPNNITKTTTYYLDLAGNVTQLVYPTGRTVNYTYDSADRPSSAADSSNGITYVADWKTPPASTNCAAGAVCYTPQGNVYSMSLGQTSSFTGINISESFNNRLQPNEIKASAPFGNAVDITYNFVDPSSGHNAGVVYGITNNLNSARSQSFTYDQLNRILSAGTSATTGTYCWGYQFSYDAWGNLLSQAGWTPNYSACSEGTMGGVTADGNNHVSGFSYDTAGNTLGDGNFTYTWDGESQLKTAGGVTYSYDGDGRRAAKLGSKLYWYGSGGETLAETDGAGNTQNEYIFFGGKRVALVPSSGNKLFYAEDLLGSSRIVANSSAICYDADFTPFGGERAYTNTCSQNYKFEGKERDAETQNDNFDAREYSWRFGRWLSSDWTAMPAPVPYANLSNPQTLNLYAMVADDPESFADLDGHCPWNTPGCQARSSPDTKTSSSSEMALAYEGVQPTPDQSQSQSPAQSQGQTENTQNQGQPAPTNPDSSPKAPPVVDNKGQPIVPGVEGWKEGEGSKGGSRDVRWAPLKPVPADSTKGEGQPNVSWDRSGHWDYKTGKKGETVRVTPDGGRLDQNHNPIPRVSISPDAARTAAKVTFWGTVAAVGAQIIRALGPVFEGAP